MNSFSYAYVYIFDMHAHTCHNYATIVICFYPHNFRIMAKSYITYPKTFMATRNCVAAVAMPVATMPRPSPVRDWSKKYHNPRLSMASVRDKCILLSKSILCNHI